MNKLALREKSGDWIYYITSLTYREVSDHVKKIDKELHESHTLSDMIQRSLTDNVNKIATYIQTQSERFFNALVLAVYDGDPKWREISIDYGEGEIYDVGVLELNGDEKIFPVDGQHRVEGIKNVLKSENGKDFEDETIPVIFIGHKNTNDGRRRTRRLFSTLNRYAKPVSLSDIIALDEDDIVAIATRHLIESCPLFQDERLGNYKQKAISDRDKVTFTNIISLYECNTELLSFFIKDKVIELDGKKLKSKQKLDAYLRFRPDEVEITNFIKFVDSFWYSCMSNIDCIKDYLAIPVSKEPAAKYRNAQNGGNILFRPIGQIPFVVNAIKMYYEVNDFDVVTTRMNRLNLELASDLWTKIAWNPITHKMKTSSNKKIITLIFQYLLNFVPLTDKEQTELIMLYQGDKGDENLSDIAVVELLQKYVIK